MSTQRLILHVGMPKTGSSALQKFFEYNIPLFAQAGIGNYWPKKTFCYAEEHTAAPLHEYARLQIWQDSAFTVDELTAELRRLGEYAKDYHTIILSSEDIYCPYTCIEEQANIYWQVIKDAVAEFMGENWVIDIMLYVRRPDLWVASHWKMKSLEFGTQTTTPWEYALEKGEVNVINYGAFCDGCEQAFGREHVFVGDYEEAKKQGIERHFCELLGLPWNNEYETLGFDVNSSVTSEVAWAMNWIKHHVKGARTFENGLYVEAKRYAKRHPEPPHTLPFSHEVGVKICELYAESNREIAERYWGRDYYFPGDDAHYNARPEDPAQDKRLARKLLIGGVLKRRLYAAAKKARTVLVSRARR